MAASGEGEEVLVEERLEFLLLQLGDFSVEVEDGGGGGEVAQSVGVTEVAPPPPPLPPPPPPPPAPPQELAFEALECFLPDPPWFPLSLLDRSRKRSVRSNMVSLSLFFSTSGILFFHYFCKSCGGGGNGIAAFPN